MDLKSKLESIYHKYQSNFFPFEEQDYSAEYILHELCHLEVLSVNSLPEKVEQYIKTQLESISNKKSDWSELLTLACEYNVCELTNSFCEIEYPKNYDVLSEGSFGFYSSHIFLCTTYSMLIKQKTTGCLNQAQTTERPVFPRITALN